jgi:NAD(P)-dependent dehydrogenase (short-subunit alcohol dehydrogenase family)
MSKQVSSNSQHYCESYIITGPTSGIGFATAFEVAKHGAVVLAGCGSGDHRSPSSDGSSE